ncbi:unnamed protein product [Ambrosiozyma monospora]|uniref:Unnamed protein product n=1 Tax=Ambrosiozyma monospora TaxID=43982 RepID=A0A9W7DJJ7_AMBMO|nr:unnamed protein product [Ambrosiozyma monospora]
MPEFHTSSAIKWSVHEPRTNCLWLHYLLHKLIHDKGLQPIRMNPITVSPGSANSSSSSLSSSHSPARFHAHYGTGKHHLKRNRPVKSKMFGGNGELIDEVSKYEILVEAYKVLTPAQGVVGGKKTGSNGGVGGQFEFQNVAEFAKWLIGKESVLYS